jgi:CheY-like chemotaxis protein
VIDIQDTGRGIAPEFLPRLFEPFSQTDDSLTRQAGGLGLGLAIAKQLVALHGGDLTATSPGPGRGATFTLTLPIAAARGAPLPQTRITRASKLDRVRILIVDDDPRVRDALALLLDRVGARVDIADSAESARARVVLHRPEILVCDIAMPGEDGYSFIRRLRASGEKTPAIALTAYAMESDAKQALAAGYDLHLAKPVDFDRLVENIRELVASSARARA